MHIRVVDLETTGFEPPAAVCEIGWSDLVREDAGWRVLNPLSSLVNPGHPIPPETSAVHHIVDADVAGAEAWDDFAHTILDPRRHDRGDEPPIAFAAHNAKFEQQWCAALTGGTPWICTYRCALRVWPDAPNHQNNTLRYWLKLPADRRRAEPTHRAGPDAYVTAYLLKALLNSASVEQLIHWSAEPALLARCTFGKHRNTLWRDVPSDYLRWAAGQQMDEDVAHTVRHELKRREQR
ncbi:MULTISPECIES: exonuclease domain-containing protein [Methylobacterium]|uniref:Exodeoxyribonuclease 10 n=1 Tax=Methylobacterium jeotgali TaxID=381630 RepID=A0ABQ4T348_9HYPH|nr:MULTISPECIES: exonuclease domain-containing protein [Methylobacterium]PIU06950.1 MAG: DNA polymerase III subunit epsilon [Methylobacterium sp. CG09_land_8_20_14_0_10_71_15]PIU16162.1 MAG: DNA polymerase III subunit epsilon [Methylobacterium sp. CG08_land_8_20_14_0_20_71_15]GBU18072.1 DNA polymerase III subunit epsilon [Methylobacterium sp.]GJE08675.1 Exodeoxyribonuclease 10 [Methylobacterium jeotgali]